MLNFVFLCTVFKMSLWCVGLNTVQFGRQTINQILFEIWHFKLNVCNLEILAFIMVFFLFYFNTWRDCWDKAKEVCFSVVLLTHTKLPWLLRDLAILARNGWSAAKDTLLVKGFLCELDPRIYTNDWLQHCLSMLYASALQPRHGYDIDPTLS